MAELINAAYPRRRAYGYRYQNGIRPGPKKLEQFRECLRLRKTPPIYANEGKGREAVALVKIFNPCGAQSWFITEWDPEENMAFGLVTEMCENEEVYMSLEELANVQGRFGIGLELDMHWEPQTLADILSAKEGR
jgi:hypothetical protein